VEQTPIELPEGVGSELSRVAADRLTPLLMELLDQNA
jgi:3,4-dihydroxy 2-butanone 4-phosphate synthase/GTP cyclohydrolase II